jgi:hypothetical protein
MSPCLSDAAVFTPVIDVLDPSAYLRVLDENVR